MKVNTFLQQYSPTEWVVASLIPGNRTVLVVGRPGGGKSWVLQSLALAVASGADFLGRFPVLQTGPVLLVDRDSPKELLAQRLAALHASLPRPASNLYVECRQGYALDHPAGVERLGKVMAQVKPVLLVLETVGTLTSASFKEEKTESGRRLLKGLDALRASLPCTIVVSHRPGKKGRRGDPIRYIRSSSGVAERVDVAYAVQRLRGSSGSPQFLVSPFSRIVRTAPAFQTELVATEHQGQLVSATLNWVRDRDPDLEAGLLEKRSLFQTWLAAWLAKVSRWRT